VQNTLFRRARWFFKKIVYLAIVRASAAAKSENSPKLFSGDKFLYIVRPVFFWAVDPQAKFVFSRQNLFSRHFPSDARQHGRILVSRVVLVGSRNPVQRRNDRQLSRQGRKGFKLLQFKARRCSPRPILYEHTLAQSFKHNQTG
jgi:hypothetical protein